MSSLLLDCFHLVNSIVQANYLFCYLFLAFIKRDCETLPCLQPYMLVEIRSIFSLHFTFQFSRIIQCSLSALDLVTSLIYIIMGEIWQPGQNIVHGEFAMLNAVLEMFLLI